MDTLETTFDADRALVYGIGGGGDVVSTIPTARLLERHGVDVLLGGITWERPVTDPAPGPRSLAELSGVEPVTEAVGLAGPDTATADGGRLTESHVARLFETDVVLVDVGGGVRGVRAGLSAAADALSLDLIVGVDAGGDALARGHEPGIRSPIADAIAVAVLDELDRPTCLGVFGYGSDGELTRGELDEATAAVAARDGLLGSWGLTPRVAAELDDLLEAVPTEASRLPVEALRGAMGERSIRDGSRTLELSPASTTTFYVDPAAVAAASDPVERVRDTADVFEAHRKLQTAGYTTEIEIERDRGDQSSESASESDASSGS